MPIVNDGGSIKYWFNGLPAEGAYIEANDAGTEKYWFNGLPAEWVNPTAGGAPPPTGTSNLMTLLGIGS